MTPDERRRNRETIEAARDVYRLEGNVTPSREAMLETLKRQEAALDEIDRLEKEIAKIEQRAGELRYPPIRTVDDVLDMLDIRVRNHQKLMTALGYRREREKQDKKEIERLRGLLKRVGLAFHNVPDESAAEDKQWCDEFVLLANEIRSALEGK